MITARDFIRGAVSVHFVVFVMVPVLTGCRETVGWSVYSVTVVERSQLPVGGLSRMIKDFSRSLVPIKVRRGQKAFLQSATVLLVRLLRRLLAVRHQERRSIASGVVSPVTARHAVTEVKLPWNKANV